MAPQEAKLAKVGSGGSIWEGTLAGPPSFLQPILHSQSSDASPQVSEAQADQQQQSPASSKRKSRGGHVRGRDRRHALTNGHQSQPHAAEEDDQADIQSSPPRVITLGQSPRGSYKSPLKVSPKTASCGRHELLVLRHPSSASAHSPSSPTDARSSQLRPVPSAESPADVQSSQLSAQDLDASDCSSALRTDCGSDLLDGLTSEEEEEQGRSASSLQGRKGKFWPKLAWTATALRTPSQVSHLKHMTCKYSSCSGVSPPAV